MNPFSVNLIAFFTKFMRICFKRRESPKSVGIELEKTASISRLLETTWGLKILQTLSMMLTILVGSLTRLKTPHLS